jgi:hypothetical protein
MKIHILYSLAFFRKSCRLWANVKKLVQPHRWLQYGACALHVGYLRLHARKQKPTFSAPTHPLHIHTYTHTHTHPHKHTCAHTQKYVMFIAFPQQCFRQGVSMLRYTYISSLVKNNLRLFSCLELSDWCLQPWWRMFTVRYQLDL